MDQPSTEPWAGRRTGRVAALMVFEAGTLAVASAVHLTGHVHGRSRVFRSDDAGVAEAVIGAVLLAGVFAMRRFPARARVIGLGTTGFAIAGFLVGLTITLEGGHLPDIAYHLSVLPLLIGSEVVLARGAAGPPPASGPGSGAEPGVDEGGDPATGGRSRLASGW